ncbi:hypothetical protein AO391_24350 [Pseudomonas marginalis ICMP 9505]|nr:hypothetical protein AO391_24350 [Pseudomonas marginalis ICMP 9505]
MLNPSNETHFSMDIENARTNCKCFRSLGSTTSVNACRVDMEMAIKNSDIHVQKLLHTLAILNLASQIKACTTKSITCYKVMPLSEEVFI